MAKRFLLFLFISCFSSAAYAQKTVYIPAYLQDPLNNDGAQFTWDKTAESTNFILIWGNTVGTNPANYTTDPSLAFNPATILDTMEFIYTSYKQLGFLDDSAGTHLSQYKIPIVIYGTWGAAGAQGFANGGDADGVIGAFWVHPTAMLDGGVAAHELTHSLQSEAVIDYRTTHGLGAVWDNAGIFWETHANFMRNQLYPKDVGAWGMDQDHIEGWGDWKNTYENYELLMAIQESEGLHMVDRLWRESYSYEYPLQAYKRLAGYTQSRFNDSLYSYARRMPTFDFRNNNVGDYFRYYRDQDFQGDLLSIQGTCNILLKTPGTANHYTIPMEQAPEEYAYNIIPLYLNPDSCAAIIKFKGHTDANAHAGWRYGFVTEHADGTVSRYSDTYSDDSKEISYSLNSNETKLYLVIMGAPADSITTNATNDTWHGYPKHFRFPYELTITGAVPEGFQDSSLFRQQLKIAGHLHSNGGGWVDNAASVAATAYVGPYAMVLGNATISGNVRIDNTAIVQNTVFDGNAQVLNNAVVNGGYYTGNAIVRGRAYAENDSMSDSAVVDMRARVSNYHLSGNIEVGGDVVVYNSTGNCDNGVYYVMTNYYQDNLLQCDNRTATHPDNLDVNNTYTTFTDAQMALNCHCAILPNCLDLAVGHTPMPQSSIQVAPNPAATTITVTNTGRMNEQMAITLYDAMGKPVRATTTHLPVGVIDVSALPDGIYLVRIMLDGTPALTQKIVIAK